MKNRFIINSALVVSVVVIWAIIVFSIIDWDSDSAAPLTLNRRPNKKIKDSIDVMYILDLNYSDPFFKTIYNKKNIEPLKNEGTVQKIIKHTPTQYINTIAPTSSKIEYTGSIVTKSKTIAIVYINGEEKMIRKGDVMNDVTFLEIFSDSLKYSIQKKIYYAKKVSK